MHGRLLGTKSLLTLYQIINKPGASFINKVPRTNHKSVLGHFIGYV